jgi:hypothetical protein
VYALTKNPDGSINLRINDFRDPGRSRRIWPASNIRADITHLPLGKARCPAAVRDRPSGRTPGPGASGGRVEAGGTAAHAALDP